MAGSTFFAGAAVVETAGGAVARHALSLCLALLTTYNAVRLEQGYE